MHIWHPFTQMRTAGPPLEIERGDGAYLFTPGGRKILDAISSWWVTVHGHAHPHVAAAIAEQAKTLEQVIFAGFTHPQAKRLARRVIEKLGGNFEWVFFSDDGSTAVEVAIKMAWQYWMNRDEPKSRILALEHSYHGDTFGAMSVSGRSIFTKAFDPLLFDVTHLPSPGEVPHTQTIAALHKAAEGGEVAALILEPLVQGAGGMLMYSPEALQEIVVAARKHGILVIFDEVMTGFGRTGTMFAADQVTAKPDIICLSKGLTGGFLPLSLTVCSDGVFEAFLSEHRSQALFHGHSFTANPLGCAAANASLDVFENEDTLGKFARINAMHREAMPRFEALPNVDKVRVCGSILAMTIRQGEDSYLNNISTELAAWFLENDVLMRPLGNELYVLPPSTILASDLSDLYKLMESGLKRIAQ